MPIAPSALGDSGYRCPQLASNASRALRPASETLARKIAFSAGMTAFLSFQDTNSRERRQMHDAGLDICVDRLGEALETVHDRDQDVAHAAVLQLVITTHAVLRLSCPIRRRECPSCRPAGCRAPYR